MSQFSAQNAHHSIDDDMDIMPFSPLEHISPSSHDASGGNEKSKISANKEKKAAEGMKDAITKVGDAIRVFGKLIAENIRTSSEIIVKKAPISPIVTSIPIKFRILATITP